MTREMLSLFALVSPIDRHTVWDSWLRFCFSQEERHSFTFTHLSCETASLHPDGIRTRSRYLNKLEAAIRQGEEIWNMEFYLLPKEFHQAVFDFRVYMSLSLREQRSHCEITVESGFPGDFRYQEALRSIREFLRIEKVEVNLLPHDQIFNYNINCILFSTPGSQDRDYGLIRRLYQEP